MRGAIDGTTMLVVIAVSLAIVAVIAVGAVLFSRRVRRHHASRAAALAHQWGWSYTARAPWLEQRWRGQSFPATAGIQIHHVVSGRFAGREAAVCELYAYRTHLTVMALATPRAIPALEMRPAGFEASYSRLVHGPYVASGIPQIDRGWRIRSADPYLVRAVMTPGMIELLETGLRIPLRFVGGDVISWHEGAINPALVDSHLARLARAIEVVPPELWQHYGYDPHAGAGGVPGLKE